MIRGSTTELHSNSIFFLNINITGKMEEPFVPFPASTPYPTFPLEATNHSHEFPCRIFSLQLHDRLPP